VAIRQRVRVGEEITYVVLGRDWKVVEPVEEYLEYLRQERYSPNTVRSYAHGLALWWSLLEDTGKDWGHCRVAGRGTARGGPGRPHGGWRYAGPGSPQRCRRAPT
jgi:hypothetical protein